MRRAGDPVDLLTTCRIWPSGQFHLRGVAAAAVDHASQHARNVLVPDADHRSAPYLSAAVDGFGRLGALGELHLRRRMPEALGEERQVDDADGEPAQAETDGVAVQLGE